MKKLVICASIVGLAAGVIYLAYKKEKSGNTIRNAAEEKVNFEAGHQSEDFSRKSDVVEEMYQAKSESAQSVNERHSEAVEIMKESYGSIMDDFVEDFSNEKDDDKNIIDGELISVTEEVNSLADDLDNLLK